MGRRLIVTAAVALLLYSNTYAGQQYVSDASQDIDFQKMTENEQAEFLLHYFATVQHLFSIFNNDAKFRTQANADLINFLKMIWKPCTEAQYQSLRLADQGLTLVTATHENTSAKFSLVHYKPECDDPRPLDKCDDEFCPNITKCNAVCYSICTWANKSR